MIGSLLNGGRVDVQTVTAGATGLLSEVDLQMANFGGAGSLNLSLYNGDYTQAAGSFFTPVPGGHGTLVGTVSLPISSLPTGPALQSGGLARFNVSGLGFDVIPGQTFSLVATFTGSAAGLYTIGYQSNPADPNSIVGLNYAGGYNAFTTGVPSNPGFIATSDDRGFQTIVDVPGATATAPGGTRALPTLIESPEGISSIEGDLGRLGETEQFYAFHWNGGSFSALADITDFDGVPPSDAQYTFELTTSNGSVIGSALLSELNGFDASMQFPFSPLFFEFPFEDQLAAGNYEIGVFSNSAIDPHLEIDFSSPVGQIGVPEPGEWALMLVGFGAMGTALRRRKAQKLGLVA
jgi:hypothetical protein